MSTSKTYLQRWLRFWKYQGEHIVRESVYTGNPFHLMFLIATLVLLIADSREG